MIECIYCWRKTGHYDILKVDPTGLSNSEILEKVAEQLHKKFGLDGEELTSALKNDVCLLIPINQEFEKRLSVNNNSGQYRCDRGHTFEHPSKAIDKRWVCSVCGNPNFEWIW